MRSFRFPSAGRLFRHGSSDAAKIAMENLGGWDGIVSFLAAHGLVPHSLTGRVAAIGAASYAGAVMDLNITGSTLASEIGRQLGTDMASELGGRILRLPHSPPPGVMSPLVDGMQEITARLNRLAGRKK